MKNKPIKQLILLAALILAIYPSFLVQAKVRDFSDINLELTVPEDTVVITNDTPVTDTAWKEAGITDPKSEKDTFTDMGVQALLYDPNTKSTVRLLKKQSSDSREIFNLSLLSDEKQNEFFNSLITGNDENTKAEVEKVEHPEAVFFRYNVEMTQEGKTLNELIYGTIVNGYSLTYDIFTENSKEPVDETFIKQLVTGTHFTKFLDKAEVEKEEQAALIRLVAGVVIIILIIIGLIFLSKKKNKKQQAIKKQKTDALTRFYMEQKEKDDQNIKDKVLFVNRTIYSEQVIKDFCYYNEFIKRLKLWIIIVGLMGAVFIFLYNTGVAIIGITIAIILLFVFVYLQGIRIEKMVSRMMKAYDKNKSMEAVFTFYDDYYTLSGIQYISKYPYIQVTEIKEYKTYAYIYLGSDKAIYLKKDGFEQSYEEFLKFIKSKII